MRLHASFALIAAALTTLACGTSSNPTAPTATIRSSVTAGAPSTAATAFVFVGYLGNQPIYRGNDGRYYQADVYKSDGSPASYAEISGFNVGDITPTNQTGTRDRGK